MRSGVRRGWIVVGGVFTMSVVLLVALAAWMEIRLPHDYDYAFPGSYGSAVLDQRTTETTTTVYSLTAPRVIVDATGRVGVRAVLGPAGRLSVRRERSWSRYEQGISETWENGRTLRIDLTCRVDEPPDGPVCRADYTLSVPAGVDVRIVTPSGIVPCRPAATEVVCRRPSP